MSNEIFNAIESKDIDALENSLENGVSVHCVNESGAHPLMFVASLIKKSFDERNFDDENTFKTMAAILIVHGASCEDLEKSCGEISNLCRYICRYIIDLSLKMKNTDKVVELIDEGRIWFENDDEEIKRKFLEAIVKGETKTVNEMIESDAIHYAFEQ